MPVAEGHCEVMEYFTIEVMAGEELGLGHLRARNSASARCKGYKEDLTSAFRPEGHH